MDARFIVLALVSVALAGCSESPANTVIDCNENPTADGCFTIDPNDVDEGKGLIRGVVIDDTVTPIEGVTISIANTKQSIETDKNGAFVFLNLDPGAYFLEASKPGFSAVQQSANVEAGVVEPPIVKMLLQRKPGTEPFNLLQQFNGYIGCAIKVANVPVDNVCGTLLIEPDQNEILDFGTTQVPDVMHTEIVWEYTQEIGKVLGTMQFVRDADGNEQRVGNAWGESPLICRVTRADDCMNPDGITGGGGEGLNETGFPGLYRARVYAACFPQCAYGAVGAGLIVQQPYQLYSIAFYNYQPPEDWTLSSYGGVYEPQ